MGKGTGMGKVRRTAVLSRQLILEAAEEIFSEKGYAPATIREVARRAGISIGGIYLYYKNKERLYADVLHRQMEFLREKIDKLQNEDPLTALELFFDINIDYASKETRLLSTLMKECDLTIQQPIREEHDQSQQRILLQILKKGVEAGKFKDLSKDPGYEKTIDVIRYCLGGLILSFISGEIQNLKGHGKTVFEFILNAIKK